MKTLKIQVPDAMMPQLEKLLARWNYVQKMHGCRNDWTIGEMLLIGGRQALEAEVLKRERWLAEEEAKGTAIF